jgi:hypothetical protein
MLQELFTYATARCPAFARGMGYLYEAIATRARYGRHREAWRPHLERTRSFVLSEAEKCPGRDRVTILGSGILLDVPLEELSARFREVVLVDVVFLPETRRQIRGHENVRLLELDVTGAAENLYRTVRAGGRSLPGIFPSFSGMAEGSSIVVSLNILSQLPVIPERYIWKKMPGMGGEEVEAWCRELVSSHCQALAALPCSACMISDFSSIHCGIDGSIQEQNDTLRSVALPPPDETWTWNLAPLGEYSRHYAQELSVGAWHIR